MSAHARLSAVTEMVRTGRRHPAFEAGRDFQDALKKAIALLREEASRAPLVFTPNERLRLDTAEAEMHSQNGRHSDAAAILAGFWKSWQTDKGNVGTSWPENRPRLVAAMQYIYASLIARGKATDALRELQRVRRFLPDIKNDSERRGAGTWAVWSYLMGVSCRMNRDYVGAEGNLGDAQEWMHVRTERAIAESHGDVDALAGEIAYRNVFSARVLAALGWVDMQRGRLVHAQQILLTAETMILDTSHEPLRLFIQSLYWVAVRRTEPYHTDKHHKAMEKLEVCFHAFSSTEDLTGQRRCASEIVRGCLDAAECSALANNAGDVPTLLQSAKRWLENLQRAQPIGSEPGRVDRHRIRWLRLSHEAGIRPLLLDTPLPPPVPAAAPLTVVDDLLLRARTPDGNRRAKDTEVDDAVGALRDSLDECVNSKRPNPVREAECYLALAYVFHLDHQPEKAQTFLDRWSLMHQFVENAFLHALADELCSRQPRQPFLVPWEFAVRGFSEEGEDGRKPPTIRSELDRFERWLLSSVCERFNVKSLTKLGVAHGTSRDTVRRRLNALGLPTPAGEDEDRA